MKNAILESLPQSDRQYIHASMVLLKRSVVLCEPGEEPEDVYFPVEAIVSYVSSTAEGQSIEVGLVGNEGMVSVATIFDSLTAFRAVVQVAAVRRVFLGYANALLTDRTDGSMQQVSQHRSQILPMAVDDPRAVRGGSAAHHARRRVARSGDSERVGVFPISTGGDCLHDR